MSRQFENPANKHREEISGSANLLALAFGMFFFLAKGVWRHVAIQFLICAFFLWALGIFGCVLAAFLWIGYAACAQDVLAGEYLRRGWREIGLGADGDRPVWWRGIEDRQTAAHAGASDQSLRTCPFCAEQVKAAAVKCRHCGSDISSSATSGNSQRAA